MKALKCYTLGAELAMHTAGKTDVTSNNLYML